MHSPQLLVCRSEKRLGFADFWLCVVTFAKVASMDSSAGDSNQEVLKKQVGRLVVFFAACVARFGFDLGVFGCLGSGEAIDSQLGPEIRLEMLRGCDCARVPVRADVFVWRPVGNWA